jgi:hypothetical protein
MIAVGLYLEHGEVDSCCASWLYGTEVVGVDIERTWLTAALI